MTRGQQDELALLRHLATAHNVQTAYHDVAGRLVEAPEESVVTESKLFFPYAHARVNAGPPLE